MDEVDVNIVPIVIDKGNKAPPDITVIQNHVLLEVLIRNSTLVIT